MPEPPPRFESTGNLARELGSGEWNVFEKIKRPHSLTAHVCAASLSPKVTRPQSLSAVFEKVTLWSARWRPKSSRGTQAKLQEAQSSFSSQRHTYLPDGIPMHETCSLALGSSCDAGLRRIDPVIPQLLIVHSTTELNALQTIDLFQKAVCKTYIFNVSVRLRTAARSATEQ